MTKPKLGVLGAGWVGLVTAVCFADLGHEVIVRDVVPERIQDLEAGRVPIYEPGLEELLSSRRELLRFTLDAHDVFEHARIVFVCVGTPPTYSGDADLSAVWRVLDELPALEDRTILVMKSTVPVGTGAKVVEELRARGITQLGYVSNPEFLAEGNAVEDFLQPDRVVIGSSLPEDGDVVERLYGDLGAPIVRTDVASAEMIKYGSNAFLATKISFINEIANVCEETGADVTVVAEGMGLDNRIGPRFLRAGIGFGGSCLAGRETVLVRQRQRTRLRRLDRLFAEVARPDRGGIVPVARPRTNDLPHSADREMARPIGLEVLAWSPRGGDVAFRPVSAVTRRRFAGEIVEVITKMGRRVCCTPDHPVVVADADGRVTVKQAGELVSRDWLPVAQGTPSPATVARLSSILDGLPAVDLDPSDVIVRPHPSHLSELEPQAIRTAITPLSHARGPAVRASDIARPGAMRLDEAMMLDRPLEGATASTVTNGAYIPTSIPLDQSFWRIMGLYLAEGHCAVDGRGHRLQWSFHPSTESDLVDEVRAFWLRHGVRVSVRAAPTAVHVAVSSRILAGWWLGTLGAGTNCHDHRIPDLIWDAPLAHKRALLAGLWRGDGSWSFVSGGPSVVLEYGTVSRELADGMLRVLGDLGIVARLEVGRTANSTRDTFWLVVSGADQVEQLLDFVPEGDRDALVSSLARQRKRIAPTGYRRHSASDAWVRVAEIRRRPYRGWVYSLEVEDLQTFVTTGGLVVHNCFPKDVSALKQLAGNSGYHFQLLTAVIEVNELQKRRVIAKLVKHLGSLRGKVVTLLGLAFKPETNDIREASSLVLAARLLAEGAVVRGWDPVALDEARRVLSGVELYDDMLESLRGADAAVVVTEWEQVRSFPFEEAGLAMRTAVLVDGRNVLDPREARSKMFVYESIGRPSLT